MTRPLKDHKRVVKSAHASFYVKRMTWRFRMYHRMIAAKRAEALGRGDAWHDPRLGSEEEQQSGKTLAQTTGHVVIIKAPAVPGTASKSGNGDPPDKTRRRCKLADAEGFRRTRDDGQSITPDGNGGCGNAHQEDDSITTQVASSSEGNADKADRLASHAVKNEDMKGYKLSCKVQWDSDEDSPSAAGRTSVMYHGILHEGGTTCRLNLSKAIQHTENQPIYRS